MRASDYQQRMLECARQAETAPNLQARVLWKWMEQFWRERADRLPVALASPEIEFGAARSAGKARSS
jgi:hypothetical protein